MVSSSSTGCQCVDLPCFFLAEPFGPVFSFPASSKSNSFRHFLSPERPSNGLRLQRHLPPGFRGPPYDRSGWCFVEARVFVLHRISGQLHNAIHVGPTSRWDRWSGQSPVCACVLLLPSGVDLVRPSSLATAVSTWACLRSATFRKATSVGVRR